jgi:hypothetical protein
VWRDTAKKSKMNRGGDEKSGGHEGVTKYELGTVMHPFSKIAGMNMKGGKR